MDARGFQETNHRVTYFDVTSNLLLSTRLQNMSWFGAETGRNQTFLLACLAFQMCDFYDKCKLDIVYKQQSYEMCRHEMQHALASKDLSCFRAYNGHRGDNATLHAHNAPLLDSGFSRHKVGNEHVRASASSKHGAMYSDNGMSTSEYMHFQIEKFESEIRKNGWWGVVSEMVPQHDNCHVYLTELWDSVCPRRGVDTIPLALATLVYYIVNLSLNRMKSRVETANSFAMHCIKTLTELRTRVETRISARENPHDSVWSRMQDAPDKGQWNDFKSRLGIEKAAVDSLNTQAIAQSLKKVHEFQYIYDLSKSEKTEILREYGLLFSPPTVNLTPVTCQKSFLMDAPLRYTNYQPLCAVTRGK